MDILRKKKVLVSGASFAGLSTAYWMNKMGYDITVVEISPDLKRGGTPVNIRGNTIDIAQRMGILEQIKANRLHLELCEFKDAEDVTVGSMLLRQAGEALPDDDLEIERDVLLDILFNSIKNDVAFIFSNSITTIDETADEIHVVFKDGSQDSFDLLFGCDGIHSAVRRIWFGPESDYIHFLGQYFSITIVNKLLIKENSAQFYNVPDKGIMLNAYNNKTDIIFCFRSDIDIPYDYRDEAQQRAIISTQFAGERWRSAELLEEVRQSGTFYFDKLCQVKMPSWTKGKVVLVGDAAYCASPAAGMGGSLAIDGAAALADAMYTHKDDLALAFQAYNKDFRPFIEAIQEEAVKNGLESFVPRTEEAIQKRNTVGF
ncbi:FAD-dependent monooxygenase [Chitinophaga pinensis]|uniref:Monooxygenase FAD-binding n=1 Tax=Chitinophaga pinensis (strain ATCC 43595 / DSM 2588 / LMG 13176 / NBRC 15968 / NCIMB 11800 / UQM 2034) TaxID=485918 RepID=A0A979G449_CHIPD|nr:FAD-dependent monooxygenase [Chitinophaga pinensis]ACU60435.1 monooxygenase FAD-binding [Chitinophaga pinensis DSM 2588]